MSISFDKSRVLPMMLVRVNPLLVILIFRCPCLGCSCRSFTLKDIVEDEEIAEKITQNQVRQQKEQQRACTSTENFSNDDTEEVHSDDDTQSQSQEIL